MVNLRQKTWGIFIRPYMNFNGDKLVHRGTTYALSPCQCSGECPEYSTLYDGDAYMLHDTATSFVELRKKIKLVMDELGYSKNDIVVTEIIPIDHIITPLA